MTIYTEDSFQKKYDEELVCAINDAHFIIHRDGNAWNEYFKSVAENIGFSQIDIEYNHCTFDGAADMEAKATLLLNPYYQFVLPNPPVSQFKKTAYEVLSQLPDSENYPPAGLVLSNEDIALLDLLPCGWSSTMATTYLQMPETEHTFYRISSGLPIYKHLLTDYQLLHPWYPRLLADEEITALLHHEFFAWIEQVITGLQILAEPNRQELNFNLTGECYKPNRTNVTVPAKFNKYLYGKK